MKFEDTPAYKKGSYAEKIIFDYLRGRGFIVYTPNDGAAHAFDNLAIRDKKQVIIAECKAKARRNHYPDTGINKKHLDDYLFIQEKHKIPVFIFFLDEMLGMIYGNFLHKLMEPAVCKNSHQKEFTYPLHQKGIVYFPLEYTIKIGCLSEADISFLRESSRRKHEYKYMKEVAQ